MTDEGNNSGYLKKHSLKGRLTLGGRWQEDLETTKQEAEDDGPVKHIDLSQFQ